VEVAVMKISEILWKAANEHLSDRQTSPGEVFICHAVKRADCRRYDAANDFLMRLGMIGNGGGFERWRGPEIPGKRQIDLDVQQQIRYAWLMFASMYAAELEARGEL
jgi:hypothetical protein